MNKDITVIGGDSRILNLINMLIKDDFNISTYGLEKEVDESMCCKSLDDAIQKMI